MRVPAATHAAAGWSPARIFVAVSAGYHLPLAVGGLVVDQTFPVGARAAEHGGRGHIFGVFETNGWHSLAALLVGLVSLHFAARPRHAREVALVLGVGHVVVFGGLLVWAPSTFWFASNDADQVVHAATAVGGIGAGLLTQRSGRDERDSAPAHSGVG